MNIGWQVFTRKKDIVKLFQEKTTWVAQQEKNTASFIGNCASKTMADTITLHQHAWLYSTGLMQKAKACIKGMLFDREGLLVVKLTLSSIRFKNQFTI